jgi:hypothetical protein
LLGLAVRGQVRVDVESIDVAVDPGGHHHLVTFMDERKWAFPPGSVRRRRARCVAGASVADERAMKPWKTLAADGGWTLRQRGEEFLVQVDGRVLMNSRRHGSEEALARIGCARLVSSSPSVLVGGLGFGFTLRAALDVLGPTASLVVSELSEAVVQWNRESVAALAGRPLEDPRVRVETGDIQRRLRQSRTRFDVVLLDVDNGPFGLSDDNTSLYGLVGLATLRAAMRQGGRLAIWSAGPQGGFLRRLREAGFRPSVEKPGDGKHLIFIGDVASSPQDDRGRGSRSRPRE